MIFSGSLEAVLLEIPDWEFGPSLAFDPAAWNAGCKNGAQVAVQELLEDGKKKNIEIWGDGEGNYEAMVSFFDNELNFKRDLEELLLNPFLDSDFDLSAYIAKLRDIALKLEANPPTAS